MALATYSDLLSAIPSWLGRPGDSVITDMAGDFVILAEKRIYYGSGDPGEPFHSPPVRVRQMETSADIVFSAQSSALPADWLGARRTYLNTDPISVLNFIPPVDFWGRFLGSVSGRPTAFTIEGENMVLGPSPDGSYTVKILYWIKFAAISTGVNALFSAVPTLWLYGSLFEAAVYTDDPEAMSRFHALYMGAAKGLMRTDQLDRFSGAPLRMRPDVGQTP